MNHDEVDEIPAKEYELPRKGWHNATWNRTENLGEKGLDSARSCSCIWFELADQKRSDGKPFLMKSAFASRPFTRKARCSRLSASSLAATTQGQALDAEGHSVQAGSRARGTRRRSLRQYR